MATIYSSTGEEATEEGSALLAGIETKLFARGYVPGDVTYIKTDHPPLLKPFMKWGSYVLVQVFDSEAKTLMFPESGFYHLRTLAAKDAGFLLKP